MAAFCLATRVQPSEYMQLSRLEREAFINLVKRRR